MLQHPVYQVLFPTPVVMQDFMVPNLFHPPEYRVLLPVFHQVRLQVDRVV